MRSETEVIAVCCSDIHLSHRTPIARAEEDWYKVMERVFDQLWDVTIGGITPLLIAGDVFHHWKQPPELINFAIQQFQRFDKVIAIPGQHDLPCHNYDDVRRSAYWTLVASGVVENIAPYDYKRITGSPHIDIWGFPWGFHPPAQLHDKKSLKIALIHSYIWLGPEDSYQGASREEHSNKWQKRLKGFDLGIFGDNHFGWYSIGKSFIFNCGTLFRRRANEKTYQPQVGLILDGSIISHDLDCSEDKFIDIDRGLELVEQAMDMTDLVAELSELVDKGLNFVDGVTRYLDEQGIRGRLRKLILESLQKKEDRL